MSQENFAPEEEEGEQSEVIVKRRYIVGPWRSVPEFRNVYEWIYGTSATNETKRKALGQIRVWNLRRGSMCPAAVLATSVVLEIQLDDANIISFTTEQMSQIASLYSNAFIRFFNYMSSIIQTFNLKSMYDTAKELNLPSFVVDLRHLCAHGQVLPPLDVLRRTARYCLEWLREYYWDIQSKIMRDVNASSLRVYEKSIFSENLSDLLAVYDTTLECYLNKIPHLKAAKRLLSKERYVVFQTYVDYRQLEDLESVFDNVVKDLFIVIKRESKIKGAASIFCEELLKMKFFMEAGETFAETEDGAEKLVACTKQLFNSMAVFGFIEVFVSMLFHIMESSNESPIKQKSASFWALKVVEGYLALRTFVQIYKDECTKNVLFKGIDFNKMTIEATNYLMQMVLLNHGINFNTTIVFSDSVRYPWVWNITSGFMEAKLEIINQYSAPILKEMIKMIAPRLTPEDHDTLAVQIDIMNFPGKVPIKKVSSDIEIHTKKDLIEILRNYNIDSDFIEGEKEMGAWTAVPDASLPNWVLCPLGRLPYNR